ncbi:MAG: ABC transporter permease subunit [Acidimicrobiales bacterium]
MALALPRRSLLATFNWRVVLRPPWPGFALAGVGMAIAAAASGTASGFPASWVPGSQNAFTSLDSWITAHQASAPVFTDFVTPVGGGLGHAVNALNDVLNFLGWPGVVALFVLAALGAGRIRTAMFAAIVVAGFGLLGLWADSLATLSLMVVSILVALLVGIPLGIVAGLSDPVDHVLRPLLDAAQMLPAYVYLIPVVILLGIGNPAGVVATVIYAAPPVIRLTSLGIRSVRADVLEAGTSFGSTRWQQLVKVQLPLALRPILLGINQVIMMALSIVVLASLIGSGGLGDPVLAALTIENLGQAFTPGLVIVAIAMLLDRIVSAYGERVGHAHEAPTSRVGFFERWRRPLLTAGLVAGIGVVLIGHYAFSTGAFPQNWSFSISGPVNTGLTWLESHLYNYWNVPVIGGTLNLSNFLTSSILNPITSFFSAVPWWVAVFGTGAAGIAVGGLRRGAQLAACLTGVGLLGVWADAASTLSQVLVALGLCVLIGFPIGVVAYWWPWLNRAIRPVLDTLQTMPAFVYLIPVVVFFSVGPVAGVIASFVYAVPATIRLTILALRGVRRDIIEAGEAFGSSRLQILRKVELPAARPAMLLAVNQTIMLVLAEVIVAGLVGAGGLGYDVVVGLDRDEFGLGLAAGLGIVLMGVVFDRLTQGSPQGNASQAAAT